MFGLGAPELVIIVLVLVVLFGWKRLPDAARSLGRSARVFKSEVEEMKNDGKPSTPTALPSQPAQQGTQPIPPTPTAAQHVQQWPNQPVVGGTVQGAQPPVQNAQPPVQNAPEAHPDPTSETYPRG